MKPLSSGFLLCLLLALCALSAWQWYGEAKLRQVMSRQVKELTQLQEDTNLTETRLKAADAEILRLTGSLTELRAHSIPVLPSPEMQQSNTQLREEFEKQNAVLRVQNETLLKTNSAIQQANVTIQKLISEREALTKRLNDTTAKYNKLVTP